VTASGIAEPRLGGARAGDGVLAPGWTSCRRRLPVSTHAVTGPLVRRISGSDVTTEVTVPPGTETTVALPLHPEALETEGTAGIHTWRHPAPPGYGLLARHALATPMRLLITDDEVRDAVQRLPAEHLPQVPLAHTIRNSADTVLRIAPGRLPCVAHVLGNTFTRTSVLSR
jgi:hypothetical protein